LVIRGELATRGGGFRAIKRGAFLGEEGNRRRLVAREMKHDAGDVVL
jgi:hypothetical protein